MTWHEMTWHDMTENFLGIFRKFFFLCELEESPSNTPRRNRNSSNIPATWTSQPRPLGFVFRLAGTGVVVFNCIYMGISRDFLWRYPHSWMVCEGKSYMDDDWGVALWLRKPHHLCDHLCPLIIRDHLPVLVLKNWGVTPLFHWPTPVEISDIHDDEIKNPWQWIDHLQLFFELDRIFSIAMLDFPRWNF